GQSLWYARETLLFGRVRSLGFLWLLLRLGRRGSALLRRERSAALDLGLARAVLRCRVWWRRIRPGGNNVLNSAAPRTSGEQRREDGHDDNAHHDGGPRDRVPPNEDE